MGQWNSEAHLTQGTNILIMMIKTIQKKFPRWTKDQQLKGKVQATGFVQERRKTLGWEHTELVPMFLKNYVSSTLWLSFSPLFYFTGKRQALSILCSFCLSLVWQSCWIFTTMWQIFIHLKPSLYKSWALTYLTMRSLLQPFMLTNSSVVYLNGASSSLHISVDKVDELFALKELQNCAAQHRIAARFKAGCTLQPPWTAGVPQKVCFTATSAFQHSIWSSIHTAARQR